jgi:glycogen debranching enzyme
VLDGSTFFVTDRNGDCLPSQESGFFFQDVRHLSTWRLLADRAALRLLTSRNTGYYAASVFGTLASAEVGRNPAVTVRRDRLVADGLREDLTVDNNSEQARRLRLEVHVDADFADLFEVKQNQPKQGAFRVEPGRRRLEFGYRRRGFRRRTTVTASQPCHVWQGGMTFELELAPHGR